MDPSNLVVRHGIRNNTTEHTRRKRKKHAAQERRNSNCRLETRTLVASPSAATKFRVFYSLLRLLYAIRRARLPCLGLIPLLPLLARFASSRRAPGGVPSYILPLFQKGGHVYLLSGAIGTLPSEGYQMSSKYRTEYRGKVGWCCVVLCCVVSCRGSHTHTNIRKKGNDSGRKTAKAKKPSFTVNLIILGLARSFVRYTTFV